MQLEEERKSYKERDCCLREQQIKIDNLSNLVTSSDTDRNSSQVFSSWKTAATMLFMYWFLAIIQTF